MRNAGGYTTMTPGREPPLLLLALLLLGAYSRLAWSTALPRAVLHVGPHKTATSYVQSAVCQYEGHLRRHGWVLPLCAQCGQHTCSPKVFAPLAQQLVNETRRWGCATDAVSCFRGTLQEARAAGRHVFISAEALSFVESDRLQLLAELLRGFNVSVVIYVRDALPLLLSLHYQCQMGPSRFQPESLGRYFLRAAMQQGYPHVTALFNGGYGALLGRWVAVFGESALHLVSYEGVVAAGLDPFLVLLDRVMGLPLVSNHTSAVRVNTQPHSRVVAATSFLVRFVHIRSDEPTLLDFNCARPFAEEQLLSLLPMTCRPFANWTAALNARERAAVATVAPEAHRHCFEHQPEETPLPEACEVEYPELHQRLGELLPGIRHVAAQAVAACHKPAKPKPTLKH